MRRRIDAGLRRGQLADMMKRCLCCSRLAVGPRGRAAGATATAVMVIGWREKDESEVAEGDVFFGFVMEVDGDIYRTTVYR